MKKIYLLIIAFVLSIFTSCASAPLPEGVGNGSESGYIFENATLPDGKTMNMHLFKTMNEVKSFFEQNAPGKWFMKYSIAGKNILRIQSKNYQLSNDEIYIHPCTLEELGNLGTTMVEKGLPIATAVLEHGKEMRQISISLYKDWKTARYSIIDYIDEAAYKEEARKKREEERRRSKKIANTIAPFFGIQQQTNNVVYRLDFVKYSDGCLVLSDRKHYEGTAMYTSKYGYVDETHRNDNTIINSEIGNFNAIIQRYNAVTEENQENARKNTPVGNSYYVYRISTDRIWIPGKAASYTSNSFDPGRPGESCPLWHYIIWRVDVQ